MRKLLIAFLALLVLAAAAVVIVPQVVDWNRYRPEIAALVRDATGRDVVFGGNLDFRIVPTPTLTASDVRIANVPGAATQDIVRLKSLGVRVALVPLLRGRLEFQSVELVEPVFELERMRGGWGNWQSSPPAGATGRDRRTRAQSESAAVAQNPESLILESMRITRGTVIFRDRSKGTLQRLQNIDARVSAGSLVGPFEVAGTFDTGGLTLDVEAGVGRIGNAEPAPVRMSLVLLNTELELRAVLDAARPEPRLSGRLTASGDGLNRLLAALGGGTGYGALAQPFSLTGQLVATEKAVSLGQMEISLGSARAKGTLNTLVGERMRTDIALSLHRIDLDKWLSRLAPPEESRPARRNAGAGKSAAGGDAGFALPANLDGSLSLSASRVVWGGELIRDIRISTRLRRGKLELRRVSLSFPGGAGLTLTGELAAVKGRAAYSGTVDLTVDNLRRTLAWMKVDMSGVPAARLRKFSLKGKLSGDDAQVQLTEFDARLDATRVTGGVNYALRRRPSFGARVEIDKVNLNSYLTPASKTGSAVSPEPRPRRERGSSGAPLAFFKDFDANIDARLGQLNYRGTTIRGVALNGTLFTGKMAIKDARVGDLAGLSAEIKGDLDGFDGFPRFRGTVAASAGELSAPLRLAGLGDILPTRPLGRFRLSGRAEAGRDNVRLKSDVEIAGAKASVTGTLEGLEGGLDYEVALDLNHDNGAALLRRFGADVPDFRGRTGRALRLHASVKGNPDSAKVAASVDMFGGKAKWQGQISRLADVRRFEGKFAAEHPNYADLARALGVAAPPVKDGKMSVSADVTGDMVKAGLSGLRARLGKAEFQGEGALDMARTRPVLTASLSAGDLDLNVLGLPLATGKARKSGKSRRGGRGGKGAASRYATEKLDLSGLDALDAEIELAAGSLTWDVFRVRDAEMKLALRDRKLDMRRVTGKLFDGSIDFNGSLSGRGTPALSGRLKIAGAKVGEALFRGRQFDIQRGVVALDLSIDAKGDSEAALVQSMSGKGRLAVRDGQVKGFDLPAISGKLKKLKKAKDVVSLFTTAMGGGSTKFERLDGTFDIRDGVVRSDDLTLVADTGTGEAKGMVDLARWNMDVRASFRLTEHSGIPPFAMRVHGPPDAPKRSLDHAKLQAYLVGRNIGRFIQKVLPSPQKPASGTQTAPTSQKPITQKPVEQKPAPEKPAAPKPDDILKGLLEGLRR